MTLWIYNQWLPIVEMTFKVRMFIEFGAKQSKKYDQVSHYHIITYLAQSCDESKCKNLRNPATTVEGGVSTDPTFELDLSVVLSVYILATISSIASCGIISDSICEATQRRAKRTTDDADGWRVCTA